jgi:sterol 14alpha-demethylase
MDKLHFCIKEALRMYPPLIFLMRKLTVDMKICGYDIPKGDTLFLSPAVSGRLDTIYTNPEKFDPDRFAPGREEDKLKQFSFVGFGGGRHGCMGETFAYLQIKTIWSVLLRKYNMEIVGELPKPDYSAMVVGPTHPCLVKYSRK